MSKALLTCPAPREEVGLQLRFRGPPPFPVCVFHPLLLLLLSRFSRVRLCDPTNGSPPGSPIPGILQARTLGCHFLLQCMKVKSESEVTQSCPNLSDLMDCSPPGSSIHGIFQEEYWSGVPLPVGLPSSPYSKRQYTGSGGWDHSPSKPGRQSLEPKRIILQS